MPRTYYEILGADMEASDEEIKAAYKRMAAKWHPDKNIRRDTTLKMQEINEAYAVLSNPHKRKTYDLSLNSEPIYDIEPEAYQEPQATEASSNGCLVQILKWIAITIVLNLIQKGCH